MIQDKKECLLLSSTEVDVCIVGDKIFLFCIPVPDINMQSFELVQPS